jgi:Zn-dependent peptidase ImmA (M78 family)
VHRKKDRPEANAFAAALLLPEKEVRKDLEEGVTVPRLAALKRWGNCFISSKAETLLP